VGGEGRSRISRITNDWQKGKEIADRKQRNLAVIWTHFRRPLFIVVHLRCLPIPISDSLRSVRGFSNANDTVYRAVHNSRGFRKKKKCFRKYTPRGIVRT